MSDKKSDFENYKITLQYTDWAYQYADDPNAYRKGKQQVENAFLLKKIMCSKYPNDIDTILDLWENKGIE